MRPVNHRCPILRLLLPLIAGYSAAEYLVFGFPATALALGVLLALAATLLIFDRRGRPASAGLAWTACFSGAAFCLSFAYYQHRHGRLPEWDTLPPREAQLEFQVERVFASADPERISGIGRITATPPVLEDLVGSKLHFSFGLNPGSPSPARTARLSTRGVLESIPLEETYDDGFSRFLQQSGVQFRFGRGPPPEQTRPARSFFRFCRDYRDRFAAHLRQGARDNAAGHVRVYVAMLLGKRHVLEDSQRDAFTRTGTLHLFAISGLHIGVIAFALHSILTLARTPPLPAAMIGLGLLLFYVEVTGGAPSAVRAYIMVAFFWSSSLFARPGNPVSALGCSAVCVLLLFPHQLWNAGFQLSYTVVTAILLLGIPISEHWKARCRLFGWLPANDLSRTHRVIEDCLGFFLVTAAVSLTATLASSPLSIHYFNVFAPGAVVLNIILVSLASLVISAGMLALALGLLGLAPLASLFNHAGWLVIVIMEAAVGTWQYFPIHFWSAEYRHDLLAGATTAALLGSLLLYAERRGRPSWINATLPFLVVGILVALGVRLTFPVQ